MAELLTGGCACGTIRYALHETPFDTGWCHCRLCQRSSGAPGLVFTTVRLTKMIVTRGTPRTWRSSDSGDRSFCPSCGAQLTMRVDHQPETIDIAVATLDDPAAVAPGFHIFCSDASAWSLPDDGLPRYARFRPWTRGNSGT